MNLEALIKAFDAELAAASAIEKKAKDEKREHTEAEIAAHLAHLDKADELKAQIAAATELKKRADAASSRRAALDAWGDKPRPAATRGDNEDGPVVVGRERELDDPMCGFKSGNDYLRAVKAACDPSNPVVDKRLHIVGAATGQNSYSGEDGGWMIPPQQANRYFERATAELDILNLTDNLILSGNSVEIVAGKDGDKSGITQRYGGAMAYWLKEGDPFTSGKLKNRTVTMKLNKIGALMYATDEELADVPNMDQRLQSKMSAAIIGELVESLFSGTGVGKPQGVLNSNALVTVSKEQDQEAATIVSNNLIKMFARLWEGSENTARWYYNREALKQLPLLTIGAGTSAVPVYLPGGNTMSGKMQESIWGLQSHRTGHCEALGTVGDIILIDWSQYFFASKGTPQGDVSMHLRFDYGEMAFRLFWRVDGKPAWETPVTPRKGSDTLSPFVALATRS